MERKTIIIIGGGPAGLMAAAVLSPNHDVAVFDKEKNIGQKFLLAGKGGFNLTNNARREELINKYSPIGFMDQALADFDNAAFREWLLELDIPTFIGSSGRVFPEKDIKPIEILNKIKTSLINQGVTFYKQHECIRFGTNKSITFNHQGEEITRKADYILFALGGASWPVTGSNGAWRAMFESMGIATNPFQASNCGINVNWPESMKQHHAGKPLKNIRLFAGNTETKGEAVISSYGLEGNAVYPLVPTLRNMLNSNIPVFINLDFKPFNTHNQLIAKQEKTDIKPKDYAKHFNLNTSQLALIKAFTPKDVFLSPNGFIDSIKQLPIPVQSLRPVEEAISTIGGIIAKEINNDFSLKKYNWIYTIGEMVDWDAPTGGFLLQGCFSMGRFAANSILKRIHIEDES